MGIREIEVCKLQCVYSICLWFVFFLLLSLLHWNSKLVVRCVYVQVKWKQNEIINYSTAKNGFPLLKYAHFLQLHSSNIVCACFFLLHWILVCALFLSFEMWNREKKALCVFCSAKELCDHFLLSRWVSFSCCYIAKICLKCGNMRRRITKHFDW